MRTDVNLWGLQIEILENCLKNFNQVVVEGFSNKIKVNIEQTHYLLNS